MKTDDSKKKNHLW